MLVGRVAHEVTQRSSFSTPFSAGHDTEPLIRALVGVAEAHLRVAGPSILDLSVDSLRTNPSLAADLVRHAAVARVHRASTSLALEVHVVVPVSLPSLTFLLEPEWVLAPSPWIRSLARLLTESVLVHEHSWSAALTRSSSSTSFLSSSSARGLRPAASSATPSPSVLRDAWAQALWRERAAVAREQTAAQVQRARSKQLELELDRRTRELEDRVRRAEEERTDAQRRLLDALQSRQEALEASALESTQRLHAASSELASLRQQLSGEVAAREGETVRALSAERSLRQTQAALRAAELARHAVEARWGESRASESRWRAESERLAEDLERVRGECRALADRERTHATRAEELDACVRESRRKLLALAGAYEALEAQHAAVGAQLQATDEARAAAEARLDAETRALEAAQGRTQSLEEDLERVRATLHSTEEALRGMEAERGGLRDELAQRLREVGRLGRRVRHEEARATALEHTLETQRAAEAQLRTEIEERGRSEEELRSQLRQHAELTTLIHSLCAGVSGAATGSDVSTALRGGALRPSAASALSAIALKSAGGLALEGLGRKRSPGRSVGDPRVEARASLPSKPAVPSASTGAGSGVAVFDDFAGSDIASDDSGTPLVSLSDLSEPRSLREPNATKPAPSSAGVPSSASSDAFSPSMLAASTLSLPHDAGATAARRPHATGAEEAVAGEHEHRRTAAPTRTPLAAAATTNREFLVSTIKPASSHKRSPFAATANRSAARTGAQPLRLDVFFDDLSQDL